jgi:hypothetical protein
MENSRLMIKKSHNEEATTQHTEKKFKSFTTDVRMAIGLHTAGVP